MTNPSIKRLWLHLDSRRRKQLALLLLMMIFTSFAEVLSIGAVLPFLGALMSPEKLFTSDYMWPVIAALDIADPNQLLLPLTLIFIAVVMLASVARLTLLWAQIRLGNVIGADLSIQIYEKTLYQPYYVHVSRNSSEVISGILNKVNTVVGSIILPLLIAASSLLLLVAILATLIAIDPAAAIVAFSVFGAVYALVMFLSKKQLTRNGERISKEYSKMVKALQEGLGGIRDVLLDGTQAVYCKIYRSSDLPLRKAQADNQIISSSPRFLIEALGITLISSLAYVLTGREGGAAAAIPLLGALAIGAQRLLPVLQQLYSSWSSFRGGLASLNDVLDLIEQPFPCYSRQMTFEPFSFQKSIRLEKVGFRYSTKTSWILKDINFEIPRGARVGFMGTTGSGKSTLLDILMALLPPSRGRLLIDEIPIDERNFRNWQTHIAHVPQSIFLADTTIAENIAFGVPVERIDYQRVEKAAEQAQIAETIRSWERGYHTSVGERGLRLSGGQRQRIGIARALYKRADVIVLDEATSALDNETETAVMRAIEGLGSDITVLIIAHRLSTLKNCDYVIELSEGRVKFVGSYSKMMLREVSNTNK